MVISRSVRRRARRGAAFVELAFCVPLIASVTLLSIDFSNKIYDKEALQIAAYEAARVASRPFSSRDAALKRAQDVLAARGITNVKVEISPSDFNTIVPGDALEVTIRFDDPVNKSPVDYLLTKPLGVSAKYVKQ